MSPDTEFQQIIDRAGPEAYRRVTRAGYRRHPEWEAADTREAVQATAESIAKLAAQMRTLGLVISNAFKTFAELRAAYSSK
jgi:hypothetical protein